MYHSISDAHALPAFDNIGSIGSLISCSHASCLWSLGPKQGFAAWRTTLTKSFAHAILHDLSTSSSVTILDLDNAPSTYGMRNLSGRPDGDWSYFCLGIVTFAGMITRRRVGSSVACDILSHLHPSRLRHIFMLEPNKFPGITLNDFVQSPSTCDDDQTPSRLLPMLICRKCRRLEV